jgi:hypothetical protein
VQRHRLGTLFAVVTMAAIAASLSFALAASASSNSTTQCQWDSSYTFQLCIRQNYTTGTWNGRSTVSVQNYQAWYSGGANGVAMSQLYVHVGIEGVDTNGTIYASTTQSWTVNLPVKGQTYTFTPSWANAQLLLAGLHAYQVGHAEGTIVHGGSTWTLITPNALQGSL